MLTEQGTFTDGIEQEGKIFKEYSLQEEVFGHTIRVMNDVTLDRAKLQDPAYYSAAILAKRLTVEGIDNITPEMVMELSQEDGMALLGKSADLEARRILFRGKAEADKDARPGAPEDGVSGGGDPPKVAG